MESIKYGSNDFGGVAIPHEHSKKKGKKKKKSVTKDVCIDHPNGQGVPFDLEKNDRTALPQLEVIKTKETNSSKLPSGNTKNDAAIQWDIDSHLVAVPSTDNVKPLDKKTDDSNSSSKFWRSRKAMCIVDAVILLVLVVALAVGLSLWLTKEDPLPVDLSEEDPLFDGLSKEGPPSTPCLSIRTKVDRNCQGL